MTPMICRLPVFALGLTVALALSGCKTSRPGSVAGTHGGVTVTGSTTLAPAEIKDALALWKPRSEADSKDRVAVLNYAAALRLNGEALAALAVLGQGHLALPDDQEIASAYGKALADSGNFDRALTVIRRVQRPDRPDWKLLSAEGAILDQMGEVGGARARYARALAIAPGEPTVLNNLALSHLLSGELPEAEKILRQAVAVSGATSRMRQNLALVIGLQGRVQEAEAVAANEIDPSQAAANAAYLKTMLHQANGMSVARAR